MELSGWMVIYIAGWPASWLYGRLAMAGGDMVGYFVGFFAGWIGIGNLAI